MTRFKSRPVTIAALAVLSAFVSSDKALADESPCRQELRLATVQWEKLGYVEPAKPAQLLVHGSNGAVLSGAAFTFIRDQLRLAELACEKGEDSSSRQYLAKARQQFEGAASAISATR